MILVTFYHAKAELTASCARTRWRAFATLLMFVLFVCHASAAVVASRNAPSALTSSAPGAPIPVQDLQACSLLFAAFSFLPPKGKVREMKEQATAFTHTMSKLMFKRHHTYPLAWFFASALLTNPGCCTVMLTDPDGQVPPSLRSVAGSVFRGRDLERLDASGDDGGGNLLWKLRISRRRTYIQFLEHLAERRSRADVLVMDPDMLVIAAVPPSVFAGGFDIGLVANKEFAKVSGSGRRMVQGGFVAVPSGMYGRAAAFLKDTVTNWYLQPNPTDVGDQTMLLKTIGVEFLARLRQLSTDDDGALLECNKGRSRVWVRSADKLNNAFDTGAALAVAQARGVVVLHFKGHLKADMRTRFFELCQEHGQGAWCRRLERADLLGED